MKNLTEIAEVLDRGGVLVHMANGMMRLRKTERNGMEVSHGSAPFIRCENFAPLQSIMSHPDNWSEYHEPKSHMTKADVADTIADAMRNITAEDAGNGMMRLRANVPYYAHPAGILDRVMPIPKPPPPPDPTVAELKALLGSLRAWLYAGHVTFAKQADAERVFHDECDRLGIK